MDENQKEGWQSTFVLTLIFCVLLLVLLPLILQRLNWREDNGDSECLQFGEFGSP